MVLKLCVVLVSFPDWSGNEIVCMPVCTLTCVDIVNVHNGEKLRVQSLSSEEPS